MIESTIRFHEIEESVAFPETRSLVDSPEESVAYVAATLRIPIEKAAHPTNFFRISKEESDILARIGGKSLLFLSIFR